MTGIEDDMPEKYRLPHQLAEHLIKDFAEQITKFAASTPTEELPNLAEVALVSAAIYSAHVLLKLQHLGKMSKEAPSIQDLFNYFGEMLIEMVKKDYWKFENEH